jgi:Xaa-Pro dipeptidase
LYVTADSCESFFSLDEDFVVKPDQAVDRKTSGADKSSPSPVPAPSELNAGRKAAKQSTG